MKTITFFGLIGLFISNLIIPVPVLSQTRPAKAPEHIAYLDHSKVRKDFLAYAAAKSVQMKKLADLKIKQDSRLQAQQQTFRELIAADSLSGGKARKELEAENAKKLAELETQLMTEKKQIQEENVAVMKSFEKKIVEAIGAVVREKGFTDVKPIGKDIPADNKDDITALVLKKLN
jgi:Skp family chaperone for outer membrane proteins